MDIWVVMNYDDIMGYCRDEAIARLAVMAYEMQDRANGLDNNYSVIKVEPL